MESLRTDHVARNGRYYRNGHHGPWRPGGPGKPPGRDRQLGPGEPGATPKKHNSDWISNTTKHHTTQNSRYAYSTAREDMWGPEGMG